MCYTLYLWASLIFSSKNDWISNEFSIIYVCSCTENGSICRSFSYAIFIFQNTSYKSRVRKVVFPKNV